MAESYHPLLLFAQPTIAERARRFGGPGNLKRPPPSRQAERLTPQFQRLQEALDRQRLALRDNPLGIQPETVLVLETVGSIENFYNAIRRVPGLEWLGGSELLNIPPGDGFEDSRDPDKSLRGQLFLVMTDQEALRQLRSLFDQWKNDFDMTFPYGLARLKQAFTHLREIRPWGATDRIEETGIMKDWQERLQDGQDVIPFEVELWFREDAQRRGQAESHLRAILSEMDGEVVQQCVLPDIAYHAILGRARRTHIDDIVSRQEVFDRASLIQYDGIMHIRPVGQCTTGAFDDTTETDTLPDEPLPEGPLGDPLVALFDGLPLAGHKLLDKWVDVDDPDGYENNYQAHERAHGTSMASLICHGDLEEQQDPIGCRLYVRPIMQPRPVGERKFVEEIPDGVLLVDLVHRAVHRMYEPENGELPAAPGVRVINLSVCDSSRPFDGAMSPWARLLDWLAWKHNVLFIVSAGNHGRQIELDIPRPELCNLTCEERERAILQAIAADNRNRRLLSPAETLNGLTAAAAHKDGSSPPQSRHLIDPFVSSNLPSVYNAQGPGYRRAVKPEILLPGGRQFLTEKLGNSHAKATLEPNDFTRLPGQRVAAPGSQGQLDQTGHARGTSNAAALASRAASFIFEMIEQLRSQPETDIPAEYDVVLAKALLVHGASWTDAQMQYEEALKSPQNRRVFRDYLGRFLGYGSVDLPRVLACTEQRVTVLGYGELGDGEGAEFRFPLPPSLSTVTDARRLTISLAWLTPVRCTNQAYRVAHLWFNAPEGKEIATKGINAVRPAAQRGTVQHEVFEGTSAVPFEDGEELVIKVNCRKDAGDILEPIRYGLAVTLEVQEGIDIPISIYQEVRERLAVRVAV